MKKVSIITGIASIALMGIWVICALVYCIFNGFPKQMPNTWSTAAALFALFFLLSAGLLLISFRKTLIEEIKNLINQK